MLKDNLPQHITVHSPLTFKHQNVSLIMKPRSSIDDSDFYEHTDRGANNKLNFPLSWFSLSMPFQAVSFLPAQPTVVPRLRDYRVDLKVWIN